MARALLAGETAIRTARQHWYVFLPPLAVSLLVLGVAGSIVAVSPGDVGGHSLNLPKEVIALVAVLFVAAVLTLRYLRWRYTTFTLTDRRVVVSRGVLSRFTKSIALDRVQDVRVTQGLLARVFQAGTVEIESAGRDGADMLRHILDPVGFSDALQLQAQGMRTGQATVAWAPVAGPPGAPPAGYAPPGAGPGYTPPPPGYNPPSGGLTG
ncbi:MAG TPA: PH domain-containing protein [Candidatus Dormibacteraeota bacterium]